MAARIRRGLLTAVAGVFATLAMAPWSAFAGTLDQQQPTDYNAMDPTTGAGFPISSPIRWAQTFTPAIGGRLDQVDLILYRDALTTDPLTVEIEAASGSGPSDTPLASASIPAASVNATEATRSFVSATFGSPAFVAAG